MPFRGVEYGPRTVAGQGSLARLGDEARLLVDAGAPVLLVSDAGLKAIGITDAAEAALRSAGFEVAVYAAIAGEPKEAEVEAARRIGRAAGARLAVAIGGGSALDAGKLAAAMLATDEPVSSFRLAACPLPPHSVPVICIPTTAGTGSEMTGTSVVSDATKTKYWFWGPELEADLALLDPELTIGLPPRFTAVTGMDALVHAIEAATNRNAAPDSDGAAYSAIRLAALHLPAAVRAPADLVARTAMLDASALGGLAIRKAGTALAHNIGHALGSLAPIPHGLAVTLAMAATAEWVVEGNRPAFARVAEAMGAGADADAFPEAFRRLAMEAGIDLDASAAAPDLAATDLAVRMAAPENASMRNATVRTVEDEDLLSLAEMTLALR